MNALAQRRRSSREDGFTLIELLIVIIILGILAAIVVFAVGSTRKDAVSSSCKTDAKSIDLSAEAVNTKVGKYPAVAGTSTGDNLTSSSTVGATNGALLRSWPGGTTAATDDYVFTYAQTGSGTGYTLTVTGANVQGSGTPGVVLTNNSTKADLDATCKGK